MFVAEKLTISGLFLAAAAQNRTPSWLGDTWRQRAPFATTKASFLNLLNGLCR